MSGHGPEKVRKCIQLRGVAFREKAREQYGQRWCSVCGYQIRTHEKALREDGDPRALMSSVEAE